jgi:ABC-type transporter Mla MlaB component
VLRKRIEFEAAAVQASRSRTNALEALAHDLRTPTTAIIAYAELLAAQADPAVREELQHIVSSANVIEELAGRLLALTRSGERAVPVRPCVITAQELAARALKTIAAASHAKAVCVRVDSDPDLPELWVDPLAIRRVLTNLLDNAIRVSPAGSSITIEIEPAGDAVRFRISDEGPGLSPELMSRIFMRYESHTGRGGLGLAISWELVTLHGGLIWAENRDGGGAVFSVSLPTINQEFTIFESFQGSVTLRPTPQGLRITFTGCLAKEDVAPLRTSLLAATEEAEALVLDLTACRELASGALALLFELSVERDRRACPCTIVGVSEELKPVLEAAAVLKESGEAVARGGRS